MLKELRFRARYAALGTFVALLLGASLLPRGGTPAALRAAPANSIPAAPPGSDPRAAKVTLILGAYTTPREAYGKAIIPAFQKMWKAKTGEDVVFQTSYQGSGAQARAVIGGFEADVVALSLEGDVNKIQSEGLIQHDWKQRGYNGMVSNSIVVLAVRKGNPKGIKDWADLAQPGLNILTPDPKTSGGAQWNINAVYGAALRGFVAGVPKGDKKAAQAFLVKVFKNVSIMDKGARESITTFEKGVGDVAITYENEVLVGRQSGQTYDYVVPRSTILIENPAAVVDANVDKHKTRKQAEAFVDFLRTPEAQRGYAQYGLRPVDAGVAKEVASKFPPVQDLWTIAVLGGWKKVSADIYASGAVWDQVQQQVR
jgi:sulfate/thiosulfate-binding protein